MNITGNFFYCTGYFVFAEHSLDYVNFTVEVDFLITP